MSSSWLSELVLVDEVTRSSSERQAAQDGWSAAIAGRLPWAPGWDDTRPCTFGRGHGGRRKVAGRLHTGKRTTDTGYNLF